MANVAPGQFNTYVPNTASSDGLVVDFSRNPAKFALPKWWQYVAVDKNKGFYVYMNVEQAGRLLNTDGRDFMWADGAHAPVGNGNLELFDFLPFQTQRYAPTFNIGDMAAEQAEWAVIDQNARIHAQLAMTNRTQLAVNAATSATYPSGQSIDLDSPPSELTGIAKVDASTVADMSIKKLFDYAASRIQLSTLGSVTPAEMMVVMNPTTARRMALAQEIRDHIKQSPIARETIEGNLGPASNYGLSNRLYDYEVVVEDAVKTTNKKGGTKATSYVLGDGVIFMCSRVGGLDGVEGSPSFSSFTCFIKSELIVENMHDSNNKLTTGRVIDDVDPVVTSPISTVYMTNVLAA